MATWLTVLTVIGGILASPFILRIFDTVVGKFNKKETQLDRIEKETQAIPEIKKDLSKVKMDVMRSNLLTLLSNYPNSGEIPIVAEKYVSRGGNSYIIPLLIEWYKERKIELPEWLKEGQRLHDIKRENERKAKYNYFEDKGEDLI